MTITELRVPEGCTMRWRFIPKRDGEVVLGPDSLEVTLTRLADLGYITRLVTYEMLNDVAVGEVVFIQSLIDEMAGIIKVTPLKSIEDFTRDSLR